MCSIIGSRDKTKIKELVKLNQHRGNFSSSITIFENNNELLQCKSFGSFQNEYLDITDGDYIICHVQAPTGGMVQDMLRVHPTQTSGTQLWHNGLITPRGIKYLQSKLDTDETFDTKLLHLAVNQYGFEELSNIEGLFSCLYIKDNEFYIFRTKHSKLYIDDELSISSERFNNSKCINYDTVYKMDTDTNTLKVHSNFKTKRFNHIILGEL